MKSEVKLVISIGAAALALGLGLFLFSPEIDNVQVGDVKADARELIKEAAFKAGNSEAPIKIVEFGDYQCPACRAADPEVRSLLNSDYASKFEYGFVHFPLTGIHPNARASAQAVEAAGKQGKYWEMAELVFTRQDNWSTSSSPESYFETLASELGLNVDQWKDDLDALDSRARIEKGMALGQAIGVSSTPTFFINDQKLSGVTTVDEWKELIDKLGTPAQ